jgi:hypothetical protein
MRTRAALLLCLASLPPAALAQTTTGVTISETSDTDNGGKIDGVLNIAECRGQNQDGVVLTDTKLSFQWTLSSVPVSNTFYKVFATTQACPVAGGTTPTTGIVDLTSGFQPTNGSQTGTWPPSGTLSAKSAITSKLAIDCTVTTNINLCVVVFDSNQTSIQDPKASAILKVDADLPGTPIVTDVRPGDSALVIHWTAGAGTVDAYRYVATATAGGHATRTCDANTTGSTTCRISNLDVGFQYDVAVQGFSLSNNPSAVSPPNSFCEPAGANCTPVIVDDFWRHYANAGGQERGGCGGAAGGLALLALAPLAPRLRRRRP